MQHHQLLSILEKIHHVKIVIYGDFCLDAYWMLDPKGGEISVETGLQAEAVSKHYYTLGGASNVAANVAALKPERLSVVGTVGDDLYSHEILRQFHQINVETDGLYKVAEPYNTVVFGKRYMHDKELPRIDFGFFNRRSAEMEDAVIAKLRQLLPQTDALIFNQQVPGSLSDRFIEQTNALFEEFSQKIILLDSRHYGHRFHSVYRKTNEVEAARLAGIDGDSQPLDFNKLEQCAQKLHNESQKPVFITRDRRGLLVADAAGSHSIPAVPLQGKIDAVGAGDTTVSALACSLAAGFEPPVAAEFAALAAGVTVQKLFQTGTATEGEILSLFNKVNNTQ
jgi:rfaE bifunctional protein kinase chain/domain